ncbi:hypothetical protein GCM10011344_37850 [Dokdonia pacifica]|uniref:Patatin-like phospholipase n=1 Tax=Dokdonia pacifica TaxID=1627892 RepID=A0A239B540_9FLAO|nr:hypothetical protein [Dokdonia pacifica]GGG33419.1 hypothetical protein GCM10011344_37850 [Dokdonia pacifica]SNS02691.1 hypothetical protein SAMN06265376_105333 [Dokdonia pacifica]
MATQTETFHIGITMAGAVSAGAYTAGFMDYLIEVLELWEEKKERNRSVGKESPEYDPTIPMYDVCIDAFGGASAGGMVGMITALSTFSKMEPVRKPSNEKTGNILYDSWVLLDDDVAPAVKNKVATFQKMLTVTDIDESTHGVPSLLNSKPIDNIADRVFNQVPPQNQKRERPKYISEDLRVLVTLCSVRGIPFEIKFQNFTSASFPFSPGHRMHEHMIIAHFKLKFDAATDTDIYLNFDPYDTEAKELMKLCTKGTGAFPIGLEMRQFDGKLTTAYIENAILRSLGVQERSAIKIYLETENFDFTNIDGGTINNEPYAEVVNVLESMHPNYNKETPMFGTIMIDPFPNFYNQDLAEDIEGETSFFQKNIWQVLGKGYSLFQQQVRVKRSGAFYKDYFRLLIFPVKWERPGKLAEHPPLACSALGGFGGFLDIEFRKHDFFLGRDNARNFLRAFFSLEYDEANPHPLFKDLTAEAKDVFLKEDTDDQGVEKAYFPIIPDILFIQAKKEGKTNPYFYTVPDFPEIRNGYFESIESSLKNRIKVILDYEIKTRFKKKWLLRNAIKLVKGYLARVLTKKVITVMKNDFTKRKMMNG